jgi:hypothetical protein
MAHSDHARPSGWRQPFRLTTGRCLRYGLFASILRQPVAPVDESIDALRHYYDLLRTIGLSTTGI